MTNFNFMDAAASLTKRPYNFLDYFSENEKKEVTRIFEQLGLPIPENGNFLAATEGGLVFHTDAGVVIRAEGKNSVTTGFYQLLAKKFNLNFDIIKPHLKHVVAERIVHDHILQPIASIETENHIIEIVPGVKLGVSPADADKMTQKLRKEGIEFWDGKNNQILGGFLAQMMKHKDGVEISKDEIDQRVNNSAYLPIKTPEFPNGVPVIADRLAAGWIPLFRDKNSKLVKLLGRKIPDSAPMQEKLYQPLGSVDIHLSHK